VPAKEKTPTTDAKDSKDSKEKDILSTQRVAEIPGLDGTSLKMTVELYKISDKALDTLAKDIEVSQEDREKLFQSRKDAQGWLKAQRKEVRDAKSGLSKEQRTGKAIYRAAAILAKTNEKVSAEVKAELETMVERLEKMAEDMGFDAASFETAKAQDKMNKGKDQK